MNYSDVYNFVDFGGVYMKIINEKFIWLNFI